MKTEIKILAVRLNVETEEIVKGKLFTECYKFKTFPFVENEDVSRF